MNDCFRCKMTGQRILFFMRQWLLAAEDRGPFAMSGYNRIKFAYCYNLASWFYFMGNNLAKELVFKPQVFDWKKLHPENKPGVWSELQCYTFQSIFGTFGHLQ